MDSESNTSTQSKPRRRVTTVPVNFRLWNFLDLRLELESKRTKMSKTAIVEAALKMYFFDRDVVAAETSSYHPLL